MTVLPGDSPEDRLIVLPDVIAPNLDILFCGTAAGAASAAQRAYYAGPGNSFWKTLHQVGLTPRPLQPHQYAQIIKWNMGFTDLAKHVSGSDGDLSKANIDVARLRQLIAQYRPRIVAFTGKRAALEFVGQSVDYGLLPDESAAFGPGEGTAQVFVLPSPSGAARRYWNPRHWHDLARLRANRPLGWTDVVGRE